MTQCSELIHELNKKMHINWINDSPNHPLRFEHDGKTIGQFYNSIDKKYHLAEYAPYERMPRSYLCGKTGNFTISRREGERRLCSECWGKIDSLIDSNGDKP